MHSNTPDSLRNSQNGSTTSSTAARDAVAPKKHKLTKAGVLPPWCHAIDDPMPPQFKPESVGGNQGQLAAWICPVFGYKVDRRNLHFLAEVGILWIVKSPRRRHCLVHFRNQDQAKYADANQKYVATLESKQRQRPAPGPDGGAR